MGTSCSRRHLVTGPLEPWSFLMSATRISVRPKKSERRTNRPTQREGFFPARPVPGLLGTPRELLCSPFLEKGGGPVCRSPGTGGEGGWLVMLRNSMFFHPTQITDKFKDDGLSYTWGQLLGV